MPLRKPGSCFVDAVELALGAPAQVLGAFIKRNFPEADCDNRGYHPTLVNIAMLELYKIGLSQVDAIPTDSNGDRWPGHELVVNRLTAWFGRPGFRCVVTGPDTTGEEHSNAWDGRAWVDPRDPETQMDEPNIDIRAVWVTTVPPAPAKPAEPTDDPA